MKYSSLSASLLFSCSLLLVACGHYAPPYTEGPALPAVTDPAAMGVETLDELDDMTLLPKDVENLTDDEVEELVTREARTKEAANPTFGSNISTYLRGKRAVQLGDITSAKEIYLSQVGKTHNTQQDMMYRRQAFNFALAEGDMATALSLSKTFTPAQNPENTVWLIQMVEAVQQEDWQQAKHFLKRGMEGMPNLQHFLLMEALLDFQTGDFSEEDLNRLVMRFTPLDALQAQWAYNRARMYALFAGADAQAESAALYQDAYQIDAGAVFTVLGLGQRLQAEGKTQEAAQLLKRFHGLPTNELVMPDFPPQVEQSQAEQIQERIGENLFGIGMLMWAQGLDVPALHLLHLARYQLEGVHSPVQEMMTYYMGMVLEQTNRKDLAEVVYRQLPVDCVPKYAVASRLAKLAYKRGDDADAQAMLAYFLKEEQQENVSPVVLKTLAEVAYQAEDFEQALMFYDALLADVANMREAAQLQYYFARAVSLERTGNVRQASDLLEKALALDPENATILNYIGYMWLDTDGMKLTQEKLQKAYSYISKAATLNPNSAAILDSLGWVYYKREEYAKAQLYLLKAIEIEPEDPTILEHMGDVSAALGDMIRAKNYWRMALDLEQIGTREKKRVTEKLEKAE